jgi:nicotinamide mononucleotide transporter
MTPIERTGYLLGTCLSLALIVGAASHRLPLDLTEVLGFVSGAWCVWLTVKENIWNWPIGLLNSAFFLVLFLRAHLFADSSLQVVYLVLGVLGWYWWLRGGDGQSTLPITRTSVRAALILTGVLIIATMAMTVVLQRIDDAAPFLDALTTVLSLIAQYMLTRKLLENWLVWLTADAIYVGLYIAKGLPLTAILYAIFFAMCVAGLRRWRATMPAQLPLRAVLSHTVQPLLETHHA